MDIVIIGTGNTATVLGKLFKKAGHSIIQVYGRDMPFAKELAILIEANAIDTQEKLNMEADVYLLAVSDSAIEEFGQILKLPGKIIMHCAGAVSKNLLKNVSSHHAVFYPLQSLKKEMTDFPSVPILIDGSDAHTISILKTLAESISHFVSEISEQDRMKMHLAAVFVNNFVNHLFTLSEDYCRKEAIDFNLLKPLIEESISGLKNNSAADLQTGPAIRNDQATIEKHEALMVNHPELKSVYNIMTKSILEKYIL